MTRHFLTGVELQRVLHCPTRATMFVGGMIATEEREVWLLRGDYALDLVIVPFEWFRPIPTGTYPDFEDFEIVDSGWTVRLGSYEAAADAILDDWA